MSWRIRSSASEATSTSAPPINTRLVPNRSMKRPTVDAAEQPGRTPDREQRAQRSGRDVDTVADLGQPRHERGDDETVDEELDGHRQQRTIVPGLRPDRSRPVGHHAPSCRARDRCAQTLGGVVERHVDHGGDRLARTGHGGQRPTPHGAGRQHDQRFITVRLAAGSPPSPRSSTPSRSGSSRDGPACGRHRIRTAASRRRDASPRTLTVTPGAIRDVVVERLEPALGEQRPRHVLDRPAIGQVDGSKRLDPFAGLADVAPGRCRSRRSDDRCCFAATPVVPDPMNGSSTTSPS